MEYWIIICLAVALCGCLMLAAFFAWCYLRSRETKVREVWVEGELVETTAGYECGRCETGGGWLGHTHSDDVWVVRTTRVVDEGMGDMEEGEMDEWCTDGTCAEAGPPATPLTPPSYEASVGDGTPGTGQGGEIAPGEAPPSYDTVVASEGGEAAPQTPAITPAPQPPEATQPPQASAAPQAAGTSGVVTPRPEGVTK